MTAIGVPAKWHPFRIWCAPRSKQWWEAVQTGSFRDWWKENLHLSRNSFTIICNELCLFISRSNINLRQRWRKDSNNYLEIINKHWIPDTVRIVWDREITCMWNSSWHLPAKPGEGLISGKLWKTYCYLTGRRYLECRYAFLYASISAALLDLQAKCTIGDPPYPGWWNHTPWTHTQQLSNRILITTRAVVVENVFGDWKVSGGVF